MFLILMSKWTNLGSNTKRWAISSFNL